MVLECDILMSTDRQTRLANAIAALVVAICLILPGPTAAATLTLLDAMCCDSSVAVDAEDGIEALSTHDVETLGADRECQFRVCTCRICAVRDGLNAGERLTLKRFEFQADAATSTTLRGHFANPPRAPSAQVPTPSAARTSHEPLFLYLQVLLV